jgi:site-specific DNA-cytosine methylase
MRALDLFAGAGGSSLGAELAEAKPKRRTRKHGLSYTQEYRAWQTMRLRCHEPTNPAYKDYGGRGIEVCERWRDSPQAFLDDMGPKPSPKHEIDRIDNSKGYSPENCRWVTRSENSRNRRSNRWIEYHGQRKTIAEWSEITGIPHDTLIKRLEAGWDAARTIETPKRPMRSPRRNAVAPPMMRAVLESVC